ncbi:hypothetical protein OKW21_000606 [Catalinimonas alkaloidigena]|uniref:hypothetical protein n=1 Tax=Catalinimonas alkaloidigena TaxID=1075417 RepID=UPI0024050966|nr:hypothetical protein [Catalinimonas alkaloidigena]MDF9795343.1 hypothetical protein [Catalinimonas alkaloidigena]
MLRHKVLHRTLAGGKEKETKRRLLAKRIRIESKGAYKVATMDIDGCKVVGAYIVPMVYVDQPIKTFRRFYGIGAAGQNSASFINSLNRELIQSKIGQVSVSAGLNEHIYIAQPVEAGLPLLSYGGLSGGFKSPIIVTVTDPQTGSAMDYYLFESVNDNLGQTTIEIE